jgi:hypothetical protein
MAGMGVTTYEVHGGCGVVAVDNVLVFCGLEQPSLELIDSIRRRLLDMATANPTGIGYVHAHELSFMWRPPSAARRRAYSELLRDTRGLAKAALVIIDWQGFVGAALLAVVSGIVRTARVQTPLKIFPKFADGSEWFVSEMRRAGARCPSERELELALDQLKLKISSATAA